MDLPHDAVLLRIFTTVADRWKLGPLYLGIVEKARELHLAGATVLRGPLGFGQSAQLHKGHLFPSSQDLPVVVEIVLGRREQAALAARCCHERGLGSNSSG